MEKKNWGKTENDEDIVMYTLKNASGFSVSFLNYGANVYSVFVPDKNGQTADVVLGFEHPEDYFDNPACYGCCVTPCGNRIGGAAFTLNGHTYTLDKNDGENNLHSGFHPLFKRLWDVEELTDNQIRFSAHKKDMEMGLPGNMDVSVTYTVTDNNALEITYRGLSDADTLFNPTNHSYFNLAGQGTGDILNQRVWLDSTAITAVNEHMIPEGEILDIQGTPMDFTTERALGDAINADFEQLKIAGGYDHNYILTIPENEIALIGSLYDPQSGRKMEIYTDRPGVQLYTGNFINIGDMGKGNHPYAPRHGVCFETQYPPNAINVESFPHPIAPAGKEIVTTTIYKFMNV